MQVRFMDWNCDVSFNTYKDNGRTAILLYDAEDGSPVATASVNLSAITNDEWNNYARDWGVSSKQLVLIKDYSENEGMLEALAEAKILFETGNVFSSGFAVIPLCIIRQEL